ncbi:MAG: efflux RND transporter periplasmic adaptor subunit VmeG [Microscillaceae bacterium]
MKANLYFKIGLLVLLILGACGKNETEKPPVLHTKAIPVKVAPVTQRTTNLEVAGAGLLSSSQEAKPSFKVGGVIQRIFVKEGDRIRRGQVLAVLNPTEINLQVAQAEESFTKTKRDLARAKNLYRDSVATLEQVQNLETALNVARQGLDIARYNQSYATIISPVEGVVLRKLMNEGEIVGPGTPVLFINATTEADWILKIGVSDQDWTRVREGDAAEVYFDAYPEVTFAGQVRVLSQGADPMTGSYQIEIRVNPAGKRLAAGMFGKARIKTSVAGQYQVVPIESLVEGEGKNAFVYVPKGQKAQKIAVQVAQIAGKEAFISKGLDKVPQVISQGAGFLAENSSIILQ